MEIYTGVGGEVIFKKYSPVGELENFAEDYVVSLSKSSAFTAAICDEDSIIASAGPFKKEVQSKDISDEIRELMKERTKFSGDRKLTAINGTDIMALVAYPIIANGDVGGAVMLLGTPSDKPTEADIKLVSAASDFLGRQMED